MVCNAIPDGGALDCSGSNDYAADGCLLGPSACVPVCIAGDCPPVELCADGSLDAQCGTDIVIGVTVNDDEAGTFDTLTATVCSDAADAVDPSVSCTNPDRISSADGCNRGPAVCVWNCAGDCGELCANGAYTGTCTDGALVSSDGAIAINDETVVFSVGIVPATGGLLGGNSTGHRADRGTRREHQLRLHRVLRRLLHLQLRRHRGMERTRMPGQHHRGR
jgi:hypothetical protein